MVYFVYRSHYDNPSGLYVKRFEADSVLAWFQSIWKAVSEQDGTKFPAHEHARRLIGRDVYCFDNVFSRTAELHWRVPESMPELVRRLKDALYVNEFRSGPHHVQVLSDDDELELGIYIFDDHYAAEHPERAAFLMRDDWRLPDGGAHGSFKPTPAVPVMYPKAVAGDGRTYFASFWFEDGANLIDLEPGYVTGVIPGVRVPDLPRFLLALQAETTDPLKVHVILREVLRGIPGAVRTVRGTERLLLKSVRADPNDTACWAAYSDWLLENDRPTLLGRILKHFSPATKRNPRRDEVLVQMHVAQASKHVARWGKQDLFHHLIFFDDLWANAHTHLAGSILRAANRWDPL